MESARRLRSIVVLLVAFFGCARAFDDSPFRMCGSLLLEHVMKNGWCEPGGPLCAQFTTVMPVVKTTTELSSTFAVDVVTVEATVGTEVSGSRARRGSPATPISRLCCTGMEECRPSQIISICCNGGRLV